MATFNIEFAATCDTKYGQKVSVCGNLAELGSWEPAKGIILQTDAKKYPLWTSKTYISVKQGVQIQFKLCILDVSFAVIRWQQIRGNRIFCPKDSLMVQFSESDASMIYKCPRRFSTFSLGIQNVRKGTGEVIEQWGSDSSSNRQMWREHEFEDEEENSLLLTQFTLELKRAVASQKQQAFATLQPQPDMQLQSHLEFGDFRHHYYNTHYFHSPQPVNCAGSLKEIEDGEAIVYLCDENVQSFNLIKIQQISIFHLIGWKVQQVCKRASRIGQRWRSICHEKQRGLILAYLQQQIQSNTVIQLLEAGVNVLVCNAYSIVRNIIQILVQLNYVVKNGQKDEFVVMLNTLQQFKVVFLPFYPAQYIESTSQHLNNVKQKVLNGFYFGFGRHQFGLKVRQTLSLFKLNRNHCLLILNLNHLKDLEAKTINEIVYLPSVRYKIIVFVITKQKFPRDIQHRISVSKNKMIFINSHGQIYANNSEIINIFYYLEVTKAKFQQNLDIIKRSLGEAVISYKKINELQIQIQYSQDKFGQLMKLRTLKCVKDVNNKSIAKIIPEINANHIVLVPFCLHSSFLIRVILKTFSYRLRGHDKGLVINIDGEDLKSLRYLQIPQGRQLNMSFLKFYLHQEQTYSNYCCNPINESQLQKFIEIISQQIKEDECETPKKFDIFCDVKNLR